MDFIQTTTPKHSRNKYFKYLQETGKGNGSGGTTTTINNYLNVDDMIGATSGRDGVSGLVPKPIQGQQKHLLRGDAQWVNGEILDYISLENGKVKVNKMLANSGEVINNLNVYGSISTLGTLHANGNIDTFSNLQVNGTGTINGNFLAVSNAQVNGNATVNGEVLINDDTQINANATVNESLYVLGNINASGSATVNGNINSYSKVIANNDLVTYAGLYVIGNGNVYGNHKVLSNLIVDKDTTLKGNMDVWGTSNVDDIVTTGSIQTKEFDSNINVGYGWRIDDDGNGTLESLVIRRFLEVPELRYNRTKVEVGNVWNAPGGGILEEVYRDYDNGIGYAKIKLEEGEIGAIAKDDVCMGIYHFLNSGSNAYQDSDDGTGNFTFAGFTTIYFSVIDVCQSNTDYQMYNLAHTSYKTIHIGDNRNNQWFIFRLRNQNSDIYPQPNMTWVSYGNFTDTSRQTSRYATRTYERYLRNVNDYTFSSANIAAQFGDLSNLTINGVSMSRYSIYLDNIYMKGVVKQLKPDGSDVTQLNYRGAYDSNATYDFGDEVTADNALWVWKKSEDGNVQPSEGQYWEKISGIGDDGSSISSITETFQTFNTTVKSTVSSTSTGWQSTPQIPTDSKPYQWCKTVISYTDNKPSTTLYRIVSVCTKGVSDVALYYVKWQYNTSAKQPLPPVLSNDKKSITDLNAYYSDNQNQNGGTWSATDVAPDSTMKYVYITECVTYSDGTMSFTTPHFQNQYVSDGINGTSVASIKIEYRLSPSPTNSTASGYTECGTTKPDWTNGKYIWSNTSFYKSTTQTSANLINSTGWICLSGSTGTGASIRLRGIWNKDNAYYNNTDYVDVVIYNGNYYKCTSNRSATTTVPSSDTSHWSLFNDFENVATEVLLANKGYVDVLGAGCLFVGAENTTASQNASRVGWSMTTGAITHTQTGLSLTSDGCLYDPNGLHLKVGNTAKQGTNLIPYAYMDKADEITLRNGLSNNNNRNVGVSSGTGQFFGTKQFRIYGWCNSSTASDRDFYTQYVLMETTGHRILLQPNTTYVFSMYSKASYGAYINDSSTYVFLFTTEDTSNYATAIKVDINKGINYDRTYKTFTTGTAALWFDYRIGISVLATSSSAYQPNFYVDAVKLEVGDVPTAMCESSTALSELITSDLLETGIDIDNRSITVTSDTFRIRNNEGTENLYVDRNGNLSISGYLSDKITKIKSVDDFLGICYPINGIVELDGGNGEPSSSTVTVYGNGNTYNVTGYPLFVNCSDGTPDSHYLEDAIGKHWGYYTQNYGMLDLAKCTGIINFEFTPYNGTSACETAIYLPFIHFNDGDACEQISIPTTNAFAVRLAPLGHYYSGNSLYTNGDNEVIKFSPYANYFYHGATHSSLTNYSGTNFPNNYALYFNIQAKNESNQSVLFGSECLKFENKTGSTITLSSAKICYYRVKEDGTKESVTACTSSNNDTQTVIDLNSTYTSLYAYILINGTYQTNHVMIGRYGGYGMEFYRTVTSFGNQPAHYMEYDEVLAMLGKRFVLNNNTNTDMYIIYDASMLRYSGGQSFVTNDGFALLPPSTSLGFTMVRETAYSGTVTRFSGNNPITVSLYLPKYYFKPDTETAIDFKSSDFNTTNYGGSIYV